MTVAQASPNVSDEKIYVFPNLPPDSLALREVASCKNMEDMAAIRAKLRRQLSSLNTNFSDTKLYIVVDETGKASLKSPVSRSNHQLYYYLKGYCHAALDFRKAQAPQLTMSLP